MDFVNLGLDVSILAAIVGISELIKNQIDKEDKFKKFYVLLPFFISAVASIFITENLGWQEYLKNVFIYTGISSYGYNVIKSSIIKKPA
jgi:small basic protein